MRYLISLFCVLLTLASCKKSNTNDLENEVQIAQVADYVLTESELLQYVPKNISTEDSSNVVNGIIEKWIRQRIWDREAEENVPSDLNIEELVAEYRSNLLKLQYEEKIIQENLDTIISQAELEENYELLKLEYLLKEPILKCWLAKIDKKIPDQDKFYEKWRKKDDDFILDFCKKNAALFRLDESGWLTMSDFHSYIPNFIAEASKLQESRDYKKVYEEFNYYIKITEFVDKNEVPPLEYIEENLKKIIYQKRKSKLIRDYTEKLYNQYTNSNKIKIFDRSNQN